jgi:hypothetical protein
MFKVVIDPNALIKRMTDYEQRVIPRAMTQALNNTAFLVRQGWRDEMPKVFDRPTQLTLDAVLYTKAQPDKLAVEIYIRNEATKGTPPSKYLFPEVAGGQRAQKPFERRLSALGIGASFYVPGISITLDQFGNIPASTIQQIISQLGAAADAAQNETAKRKGQRNRKQAKKGGGGRYFIAKPGSGLRPGAVYERIQSGFGSAVRIVLFPIKHAPNYRTRFNAEQIARRLFDSNFKEQLSLAIANLAGQDAT